MKRVLFALVFLFAKTAIAGDFCVARPAGFPKGIGAWFDIDCGSGVFRSDDASADRLLALMRNRGYEQQSHAQFYPWSRDEAGSAYLLFRSVSTPRGAPKDTCVVARSFERIPIWEGTKIDYQINCDGWVKRLNNLESDLRSVDGIVAFMRYEGYRSSESFDFDGRDAGSADEHLKVMVFRR